MTLYLSQEVMSWVGPILIRHFRETLFNWSVMTSEEFGWNQTTVQRLHWFWNDKHVDDSYCYGDNCNESCT